MTKHMEMGWDVFPCPDTGKATIGYVETHSNLVRAVATGYYDQPDVNNLIAAAPELLIACKAALATITEPGVTSSDAAMVAVALSDVIAKAEGQS